MDISETLAPNSDQLDAIELAGGPRTFRIKGVSRGSDEQPVNVHFHDFPRAWRPAKSMRRVLAACWGPDASLWTDRLVTLYLDPEVTFGKEKPGGTRIAALSHIDGVKRIPLLVARGRTAVFTVQPLADEPAPAAPAPADEPMTVATRDRFFGLFAEIHPTPKTSMVQAQLDYIGHALGAAGPAPSFDVVTEPMMQTVVAALEAEAGAGAETLPIDEGGQS